MYITFCLSWKAGRKDYLEIPEPIPLRKLKSGNPSRSGDSSLRASGKAWGKSSHGLSELVMLIHLLSWEARAGSARPPSWSKLIL